MTSHCWYQSEGRQLVWVKVHMPSLAFKRTSPVAETGKWPNNNHISVAPSRHFQPEGCESMPPVVQESGGESHPFLGKGHKCVKCLRSLLQVHLTFS